MSTAALDFGMASLESEGFFNDVYIGYPRGSEDVAIKRLKKHPTQWRRELTLTELEAQGRADHPNLVKLIGYCIERPNERLLVYEYMSWASLDNHLHGPTYRHLDVDFFTLGWNVRIKIAVEAARGLEYLHYEMNPPMIHGDIKSSNILLDHEYNAKLSNFGFPRKGPTAGYIAPEYLTTRDLTFETDIYSFGVVILEMFMGRKALDLEIHPDETTMLVPWALNLYNSKDDDSFLQMVDPVLEGHFPKRGLHQVLDIAMKCLEDKPKKRPSINKIVGTLDYINEYQTYEPKFAQVLLKSQGHHHRLKQFN